MFLLAVSQPKFVKVSNPFRPPVVSWKMCIVYSLVFTGIIALFYYSVWPFLQKKLGFKTKKTAVTESSDISSSRGEDTIASNNMFEQSIKQKPVDDISHNEKDHLKNHSLASFRV